jgi:ribonuclease J
VVLDKRGKLLAPPQLTIHGLLGEEGDIVMKAVAEAVERAVKELSGEQRLEDEIVREAARVAVRRAISASHGKKPVTDVHVIRI